MKNDNFVDEEYLLLERPNIREELNIHTDEEMQNYLALYNAYNNLLVQYMMKKYYLADFDKEMESFGDDFKPITSEDKDLYQHSSEGYLNFFYLRNNIHVERLSEADQRYLLSLRDYTLTEESEKFIERTYFDVILEDNHALDKSVNYGPDNYKFNKPADAIIIGVRYDQFGNLEEQNAINLFATAMGKLQLLTDFLSYKVNKHLKVPFYVIIYDEYSVNCKKKITLNK